MKKFYLFAALALATLTTSAQQRLNLSTYQGTDVANYDGKTLEVNTTRTMFKGWNTLSLPFALSEQELNQFFGSDCKLEKLVGVEEAGNTILLNFQDCKASGVQPNTPYILFYTGENGNVKIATKARISNETSALSFTTNSGDIVKMCGAAKRLNGKGLYGVKAIDNSDAKFVTVDTDATFFYATRCYITLSSGTDKLLTSRHMAAGETTSITDIATENEKVDVYNTNGIRVATKTTASQVNNLKPGIYVVKGQKILVK